MTNHTLKKVLENGILSRDHNGKEEFLNASHVVIAIGNIPNNGIYGEIRSVYPEMEVYMIGDCLERGREQQDGQAIEQRQRQVPIKVHPLPVTLDVMECTAVTMLIV